MKKIFTLLLTLIIFGCSSSSDDSPQQQPVSTNGSLSVSGQSYSFDKAKITKNNFNPAYPSYQVELYDNNATRVLSFTLENTTTSLSDANSGTYSNNTLAQYRIGLVYFLKDMTSSSYTTVFNQNDFVGTQSRVIVTKNNDGTYNFNINFITTLGTITGNYLGTATKVGF